MLLADDIIIGFMIEILILKIISKETNQSTPYTLSILNSNVNPRKSSSISPQ